jgi:hypothetical protein
VAGADGGGTTGPMSPSGASSRLFRCSGCAVRCCRGRAEATPRPGRGDPGASRGTIQCRQSPKSGHESNQILDRHRPGAAARAAAAPTHPEDDCGLRPTPPRTPNSATPNTPPRPRCADWPVAINSSQRRSPKPTKSFINSCTRSPPPCLPPRRWTRSRRPGAHQRRRQL